MGQGGGGREEEEGRRGKGGGRRGRKRNEMKAIMEWNNSVVRGGRVQVTNLHVFLRGFPFVPQFIE